MQPGYVISNFKQSGKQFFKFSPVYSMFIEIRNNRFFVFAVIFLVNYSVLFSLVDSLKVKCDVVFPQRVKNRRYVVFDRFNFPFG